MIIELFARGLVIGLALAAPVGPIGMLVIRRTLAEGRLLGLATGMGAAVADALYAGVGAFGLTFISSFLAGYSLWTKLVGGMFLCYLGVGTFHAGPGGSGGGASKIRYVGAFFSTVLLTLANPVTILSFMAIFVSLGLGTDGGDYAAAGIVVSGVFLGSALWWVILSGGMALLRHRLPTEAMKWINRGSGVLLFGFGATAILSSIP